MPRYVRSTNGWQDPEAYEAQAWRLNTPRGAYVRERRLQAVASLIPKHGTLLDIGSGPATLSKDFPCQVVACDTSVPMLRKAKERIGDVVRCDAQFLPIRDRSFDLSFESSCLYLVDEKQTMLEEMKRIARRRVIVFESNRLSPRRLYDKYVKRILAAPEHPTPGEVREYMHRAGMSPKLRMVGFSPIIGGELVLRLWKPLEWFVESCPVLRLLAGGILAYADLEKP